MYCLIVTDDYSRFTWVFFLATKDETSGILKSFITGIENLVDHKVKQNGVAERRNRTLIEDARTMLADSKLPTTFWAEAVNTACFVPIVIGTQSNGFVGTKASDNQGQARKETEPKVNEDLRKHSECINQEKEDNFNSTNNVNTVSLTVNAASINEVNAVGGKTSIELSFDPNMPALEDDSIFDFSRDDEDDGAMADMNDLDTHNPSQIEAMQEELLQFKLQEVWTLVDLPNGKRPIGTKWVFRNKKDEKGIVIRNKARLVAQGYTQDEGIDYDEVFALVAKIEAIRLFLAYASFKDFVVYQMDVKSVFLYGKIEEEVYVYQPPGFEDPDFPDRVYKVEKLISGLHQLQELCKKQTVVANSITEAEISKESDDGNVVWNGIGVNTGDSKLMLPGITYYC
ncbi:putative ribonuclease H-like domain-containing protein [Tanacetum coccineum]|uniref:Ribonuclease H-like domain-containing protein n=1 Tax=Tanacetum coccineum TaxID=301880 RepID=A0ABQ5B2Y9_9ASTR